MDCMSYSYAPHMLDEDSQTYANYESNDFGYINITLEQWGSDPDIRHFVVSGFCKDKETDEYNNISEDFITDVSQGWETMRSSFAKAARVYNRFAPDEECIPLF